MQRPPALDPAMSLADFAAATASTPEPVGLTLRAIAERGFTGEVTFLIGSGVRVHFDHGHPYIAERINDEPLGRRLVSRGVIDQAQLSRGMVAVGEVEHLGRLFQRERTIDRAVVISEVESMTDELLTEIAGATASVTITPYRHHRSGVHRWFVGPRAEAGSANPPLNGEPATPEQTFLAPPVELSAPPTTNVTTPDAGLRIEWDEPLSAPAPDSGRGLASEPTIAPADDLDDLDEIDITAEIESFDADRADWSGQGEGGLQPPSLLVRPAAPEPSTPESVPAADVSPEPPLEFEPPAPMPMPAPTAFDESPAVGAPIIESTSSDDKTESLTAPTPVPPLNDPVGPATDVVETPALGAPLPATPAAEPDEFVVMWPDGSEQATTDEPSAPAAPSAPATPVAADPAPVADAAPTDLPQAVAAAPVALTSDEAAPAVSAEETSRPEPDAAAAEVVSPAIEPSSISYVLGDVGLTPHPGEESPSTVADASVPDDVAEAVRRALAAIERAALDPTTPSSFGTASIDLPSLSMPKLLDPSIVDAPGAAPEPVTPPVVAPEARPEPMATPAVAPAPLAASEPVVVGQTSSTPQPLATEPVAVKPVAIEPVATAPVATAPVATAPVTEPVGMESVEARAVSSAPLAPDPTPAAVDPFAPPTNDMRAEAVYARAAEQQAAAEQPPEPGRASVVFVDEPEEADERSGALRRLIGSLRKK